MTVEQQMLFDMARSHTRMALERLNESNVTFALSHINEAKRALELYKQAAGRGCVNDQPQQPGKSKECGSAAADAAHTAALRNTGIIEV